MGTQTEMTSRNSTHYLEAELSLWLFEVKRPPGFFGNVAYGIQGKINGWIPEKIHRAISLAIENMVKTVLVGSELVKPNPEPDLSLMERELKVRKSIKWYRNTASAEGALTGAGGFFWGLADFPAFLTIKMKMLFDIASFYGFDTKSYQERLFLLYVFQLSFSGQKRRNELIGLIENWENYSESLPKEWSEFDWKTFQLDYRDYIDLAKLAQMIPVIGAPVGAIANYKLTEHLGRYAMNCYRLRWRANSLNS
jgi:uncharacterized protein (DUF697 family)